MLWVCTAVILLLRPYPAGGQAQKPNLLATAAIAAKIRNIQSEVNTDLSKAAAPVSKTHMEHQFGLLKQTVTGFVIAQLNTEPKIESWQLRDQPIRIFGGKRDDQNPTNLSTPPYVFRGLTNKDGPSVWAVAYQGDAYFGIGGARTVVESYVVEKGNARLAGRGGPEVQIRR